MSSKTKPVWPFPQRDQQSQHRGLADALAKDMKKQRQQERRDALKNAEEALL